MRLPELIDIGVLGRLAEANFRASGMPVGLIDAVDGSVLVGVGWQEICVKYHRAHPETAERCRESDDHVKRGVAAGDACEYRCRNGLRDIGIPIAVAGTHLATLFMGQFSYDDEVTDREFFRDQARRFGFDERAYLAALDRVPVFTRSAIENILAYNAALARFISDVAEASLRQREAAEALRRSEAQARTQAAELGAILDCVGDGVIVYDLEGRIVRSTPSANAILGVTAEEHGEPVRRRVARRYEIVSEDGRALEPDETPPVRAAIGGETIRGEVVRVRSGGGEPRWIRTSAMPLLIAGERTGAVLSVSDITEAKRAEEKLRRHELVVRHSRDVILFIRRSDGRILEANQAATAAYGYGREELLGLGVRDLRAPETLPVIDAQLAAAGSDGILFESMHRRKDGSTFPVEVSARGVQVHGEEALISVIRDITGRRRAEEALRASEERFRTLADNIAQLAWMAEPGGDVTWYNQRWLEYTGTTAEELAGGGWRKVHHPDHVERVGEKLRRCFEAGEPWEDTFPLRRRDGAYRWFLSRAVPIRDDRGAVVRWFGTNTDVTEQRAAEEALREADRRKDEFLGMLSHELRNPLAPIRNALYILDRAEPDGEQAKRAREVANRQIAHMTRLVDDLLDVTRIARGKIQLRRERVDLRELVLRAAEDFRLALEDRGVQFRTELPGARVTTDADPTRITQMVGNLLHNAGKFTSHGDAVTLSLTVADDRAVIRVRDSGVGIDPALLDHVFEPFVQGERTLARTDGGLGLGLALVKGVAELHGGTARAESSGIGSGAEFVICLPVAGPEPQASRPWGGGERDARIRRVLVVDDNADAAESLADVVRLLGHEVEVAFDGPTAIELAKASRPDVILCDIGLPGMNGYDVARAIRASRHDSVQLVAVSGYAQPEDVRRAVEAGFDGHVPKPADLAVIERLLS